MKTAWKKLKELKQFSLPATFLSRHVAMCTARVCGAQCSMPVKLDLILKERRLHWYGHVERSNGAVKTASDIQVNGKRGSGRPKMT